MIREGLIPHGEVDERSIKDVQPDDLAGFVSCHWFAGIGGWPLALRLAGWPDERPVWTGSCPCQPFSAAGKGLGEADPRHLWPDFRRLIGERKPSTTFGEQVASKDGRNWLARVRVDLEALGYAVGAADLCAAGAGENGTVIDHDAVCLACREQWDCCRCVMPTFADDETFAFGAPHIRQRLFWLANTNGIGLNRRDGMPCDGHAHEPKGLCSFSGWDAYDLLPCTNGKTRRIEPGTFPLAHGVSGRVGMLRGYGNAIVPQVAATFILAFLEVEAAGHG